MLKETKCTFEDAKILSWNHGRDNQGNARLLCVIPEHLVERFKEEGWNIKTVDGVACLRVTYGHLGPRIEFPDTLTLDINGVEWRAGLRHGVKAYLV